MLEFQRLGTALKHDLLSANAIRSEPWIAAIDAAKRLGVANDTIFRRREHKGRPAHKVGRFWKFQSSEVDEWVRAGVTDANVALNGQKNCGE